MLMWKSVERRYRLIAVKCWLVIYGSQTSNQEITEFVRTRGAAGIHLVEMDGVLCSARRGRFCRSLLPPVRLKINYT